MPNEDHQVTAPLAKASKVPRYARITIALLLVGGLVTAAFMVIRDGGSAKASKSEVRDPTPASRSHTPKSINEQGQLIARLKEILATREQAYRKKDPEALKGVYTVDCPCLESDSNAIRELISANYVWVGGETSVRVRRIDRVTARMWSIIADFSSEPLRVETESGRLIRSEPRGRDLFQFVLVKPTGATRWLLGRASSYRDG